MLNIKYKRKPEAILNMTPMIDIVFLLLIFFLLTTNFIAQEGIDVNLPQAMASNPKQKEEITVYITSQGRVFLGEEELGDDQLFDRLSSLIGDDQDKMVTVRADRQIILNKVIKVMDIAKSCGAASLCIATQRDL